MIEVIGHQSTHLGVGGEIVVERSTRTARGVGHGATNQARDVEKTDGVASECRVGHFIGRVHHTRQVAAGFDGLVGDAQAVEFVKVGALERETPRAARSKRSPLSDKRRGNDKAY